MSQENKNVPWQKAIQKVLNQSGKAMHYADIAKEIINQKLRKDVGATPASTVNANITWDIKQHPEKTPYERVDRGIYKLRILAAGAPSVVTAAEAPPEAEEETIEESAGIIQAFGMFWRRELVQWSNNPRLLGQQYPGAEAVDFCNQSGVYLLHDGQRVVYVGQAADQPLGRRLNQHTCDRLNGRWDRFSWFGIRRVTKEGKLVEADLESLSTTVIITTLEALLIEGLEPPQNRKRGEDFSAVEYLQVEDPALRKKQQAAMLDEFKAQMLKA